MASRAVGTVQPPFASSVSRRVSPIAARTSRTISSSSSSDTVQTLPSNGPAPCCSTMRAQWRATSSGVDSPGCDGPARR